MEPGQRSEVYKKKKVLGVAVGWVTSEVNVAGAAKRMVGKTTKSSASEQATPSFSFAPLLFFLEGWPAELVKKKSRGVGRMKELGGNSEEPC